MSIADGVAYVRDRAHEIRSRARKGSRKVNGVDRVPGNKVRRDKQEEGGMENGRWGLVVQDCFSGGMVPGELFTVGFWEDLKVGMRSDGIVAVVSVSLFRPDDEQPHFRLQAEAPSPVRYDLVRE